MGGVMKVHLYQVSGFKPGAKLEKQIHSSLQRSLEKRLRSVGAREMRLEAALAPNESGNRHPFWLLDFTNMRFENGPGKASRSEPIEGFDLDDDEGFGEETAALYDPKTQHILVQYNHYGPRAGSIAAYLAACSGNEDSVFEFRARLDEHAEARLAKKQIIKKIHYKIATPKMTSAMRQSGVSIESALELSEDIDGQTVEVVVSAGRGRLAQKGIFKVISSLMRINKLSPSNGGPLETFKIFAQDGFNTKTELIDMLSPTLEVEIDGLELGVDRRYTRESRWKALLRAHAGWQDEMSL